MDAFVDWLQKALGIDLTTQGFWPTLHELVANVIKHGEGRSAEELRTVNRALFDFPGTHDLMTPMGHSPVAAPLAGGDIYVTDADLGRYFDAVLRCWEWLGSQLKGNSWSVSS